MLDPHCLVLDGLYRCDADGVPRIIEAGAPTDDELDALLHSSIAQLMKMLIRRPGAGHERAGKTSLPEPRRSPSPPYTATRAVLLGRSAGGAARPGGPMPRNSGSTLRMRRKALLADRCPFRQPLCDYFAATFEGRFQVLVQPAKGLQEIDCTSMGDSACVF